MFENWPPLPPHLLRRLTNSNFRQRVQKKENDMFGLPKGNAANNNGSAPLPQQFPRSAVAYSAALESLKSTSSIGSGTSVVGKIVGDGTVKIFGRVEGELRGSTVLIAAGAQVEGDVFADDLTVGGRIKGTIHANRVKLDSTAVVEGDIFHRSLAIEENARFEGSSRREEAVVGTPSRVQATRPPPGVPNKEQHATPAAE